MVNLLSKIFFISADICCVGSAGNQGGLGLLSLRLLAALLGSLLLLHLLVTEGSKGTSNLLNLIARQFLGQLLREFLKEQGVVCLLVVATNDGDNRVSEILELRFGLGVEEGERAEVDCLGRILRIDRNGRTNGGSLASITETNAGITE